MKALVRMDFGSFVSFTNLANSDLDFRDSDKNSQ